MKSKILYIIYAISVIVLMSGCYPDDDLVFEEFYKTTVDSDEPVNRTPILSTHSVTFTYSNSTKTYSASVSAGYIAYDYSISEFGLIYSYNSSGEDIELSLDSYMGRIFRTTSANQLSVNFSISFVNPYKYHYYYRLYIKTSEGDVFYSDIDKTEIFE